NQIVGIALSTDTDPEGDMDGGTLTFGGVDTDYIIGEDESNIIYYPFLPFTETDQTVRLSFSNVYFDGVAQNYSGTVSFNGDIKNIQFGNFFADFIVNVFLPGGVFYPNGSATIDCNISTTLNLSFEFNNQTNHTWRLPASAIVDEVISGNECSSTITGGANDSNSWVFGSTFFENFYMVFDQVNSQLGIAARSDIDYGPNSSQVNVMVQIPILINRIQCLIITEYDPTGQEQGSQVFSVDNVDSNDYYYLGDDYFAQEGFFYSIRFFTGTSSDDHSTCQEYGAVCTPNLSANLLEDPWIIGLQDFSE
ncbi:20869_t:CDS:2, partial [Gigaspora rosea]